MADGVDRFQRISRLGSGGMGSVWKARDLHTGQLVALKLMHEHLAEDEYLLQRFEHEVELNRRAMAGVASPNLVRVLGYGREDGRPYIAMELVEGPSLRAVLKERGALPWHEAKGYLRGVATALQAACAAGVIHRDVKPSNILITDDGTAKLADFGIAKASDMTGLTGSNTALGTVQYMPPDRTSDFRSDFYSLGVVLYEMLSGRLPFDGTPGEIIAQHASAEPDLEAISEPQARRIVAWLMQKEPARRPATPSAIVAALDGTTPPPGFRDTGATKSERSRWRKAALPAAFAVAALVAGAGGAAALLTRSSRDSDSQPTAGLTATATVHVIVDNLPAATPPAALVPSSTPMAQAATPTSHPTKLAVANTPVPAPPVTSVATATEPPPTLPPPTKSTGLLLDVGITAITAKVIGDGSMVDYIATVRNTGSAVIPPGANIFYDLFASTDAQGANGVVPIASGSALPSDGIAPGASVAVSARLMLPNSQRVSAGMFLCMKITIIGQAELSPADNFLSVVILS